METAQDPRRMMNPALSLAGPAWFFNGRLWSRGCIKIGVNHAYKSNHHYNFDQRFILIVGTNDNFVKYQAQAGCCQGVSILGYRVDKYPELGEFLLKHRRGEILTFLSLGPQGAWFARTANGRVDCNLPARIMHRLHHLSAAPERITRIWFGYEETFVAEFGDEPMLLHLGHHYPGLQEELQKPRTVKIAGLAMDLTYGSKFACIWRDGEVRQNEMGSGFADWYRANDRLPGSWGPLIDDEPRHNGHNGHNGSNGLNDSNGLNGSNGHNGHNGYGGGVLWWLLRYKKNTVAGDCCHNFCNDHDGRITVHPSERDNLRGLPFVSKAEIIRDDDIPEEMPSFLHRFPKGFPHGGDRDRKDEMVDAGPQKVEP